MSVWFPVAGSQFTPQGLPPAEIWDHSGQCSKTDSRFAPSQWETALLCNDVSHWLGANLESALYNGYSLIISVDADTIRKKHRKWLTLSEYQDGLSRYRDCHYKIKDGCETSEDFVLQNKNISSIKTITSCCTFDLTQCSHVHLFPLYTNITATSAMSHMASPVASSKLFMLHIAVVKYIVIFVGIKVLLPQYMDTYYQKWFQNQLHTYTHAFIFQILFDYT